MTTAQRIHTPTVLDTDDDVLQLVAATVGAAIRDQLWAIFVDPDRCPYRLLIPIDGLPDRPDASECEQILSSLGEALDLQGGGELILVRERRGAPRLSGLDLVWANALSEASRSVGTPLRCVLVSHDTGVCAVPSAAYAEPFEPAGVSGFARADTC